MPLQLDLIMSKPIDIPIYVAIGLFERKFYLELALIAGIANFIVDFFSKSPIPY